MHHPNEVISIITNERHKLTSLKCYFHFKLQIDTSEVASWIEVSFYLSAMQSRHTNCEQRFVCHHICETQASRTTKGQHIFIKDEPLFITRFISLSLNYWFCCQCLFPLSISTSKKFFQLLFYFKIFVSISAPAGL